MVRTKAGISMKKKVCMLCLAIVLLCSIFGCTKEQNVSEENEYNINAWERGVSNICRSEQGYYAISADFLYVIDENKNATPLCNKADCDHMNVDCNAYVKNALTQTVWYDGNNIYVVAGMKAGKYALYKMNADGSGNEKICDLFQSIGARGISVITYFYKNYMYYTAALQTAEEALTGRMNPKLYRVELRQGAESELIYEFEEGSNASIGRCIFNEDSEYIDEDNMYIVLIKYTDTGEDNSSALYRYSLTENKLEIVIDHFVSNYFMKDDMIYYTSTDGIHKYDIKEKTDEIFYEDPRFCSTMIFDGKYIYLDDSWYQSYIADSEVENDTIFALDLSGNVVQEISVPEHGMELYWDGSEIIERELKLVNEENRSYNTEVFHFFDKSQIGNGANEWTELEIMEEVNIME